MELRISSRAARLGRPAGQLILDRHLFYDYISWIDPLFQSVAARTLDRQHLLARLLQAPAGSVEGAKVYHVA